MNCKKRLILILAMLTAATMMFTGCKKNDTQSSKPEASSQVQSEVSSEKPESKTQPQQTPGIVEESEKADFSYLDDAVFIGDSVSLKLKNYVTAKRKSDSGFFGKAQFLTAGSMGSGNALKPLNEKSIHPTYKGTKALFEDSVAAMKAKKVYIMLGMNDITIYGPDGAVENMHKLIDKIKQKSPDAKFFVQSATPMVEQAQRTHLNNRNVKKYDDNLKKMCEEKGYYFVDVASVFRDDKGNLPVEYCSDPNDMGIHFTDKACEAWIDYILTHTVK